MKREADQAGRIVSAIVLTAGLLAGLAHAQVPPLLSYQGKLLDSAATPVADGSYAMEFRFYDDCASGTLLLTDAHAAVSTNDGMYSVLLGSGTLTPGSEADLLSVFSGNDLVCLGVQVESDSEMVPRQQIVSAGFAMRAAVADAGVGASVFPGDDVTWSGTHRFQGPVTFESGSNLFWPHVSGNPPPDVGFRIVKFEALPPGQESHPNLEQDEQWMVCYNCEEASTQRQDPTQHAWNEKIESNYWDGIRESLEHNWNYTSPTGNKWRPFAFRLVVDGSCSNDASPCTDDAECGSGNSCVGANQAEFQWNHGPGNTVSDLEVLKANGVVRYGRGLDGLLDLSGSVGAGFSFVGHRQSLTVNTEDTASGPTMFGSLLDTNFASSTADAQLSDLLGLRSTVSISGSAPGRDVVGQVIAVDAVGTLSQDGAGSSVQRMLGFRYKFQPTGNDLQIGESNGLRIDIPSALAGSNPVQIDNHYGIAVRDQGGLGSVAGAAISISAQSSSPDPDRGNLRMKGGGWNDGHVVLENAHLWMDKTFNVLRVKDGAPTGESDGAPLHVPPGTDSNWGGMYWGDTSDVFHDSGTEVCTFAGLTCKESYDMGGSTPIACNSSTHTGTAFLALCY